jgi:2-dehydro-3-deoxy-L-rhamnonate dehydrogenase (NAD+)
MTMGVDARYAFAGRTIMITGGAGDIGRAAARRFARDGAAVVVCDVADEAAHQVVEELGGPAAGMVALHCDVTDHAQVERAVEEAARRCGRIDYLFNNAGYQGAFAPTQAYPLDDFDRVVAVNVRGVFSVLGVVARHMVDAGGGAIVNTASHAGVRGPPNMVAYAASKFAVVGMTQTAAKDLAPHGVRVNAISPALIGPGTMWERQVALQAMAGTQYFDPDPAVVERGMVATVPMRRLGTLDEVANAVAFLMSDEASYLTGVNLEITGGI